jgi:hypothetical protein
MDLQIDISNMKQIINNISDHLSARMQECKNNRSKRKVVYIFDLASGIMLHRDKSAARCHEENCCCTHFCGHLGTHAIMSRMAMQEDSTVERGNKTWRTSRIETDSVVLSAANSSALAASA